MRKNVCCVLLTLIAICVIYISTYDVVKTDTINGDVIVKYVDSKILTEDLVVEDYEVNVEEETEVVVEKIQNVTEEVIVEEKSVLDEPIKEVHEEEQSVVSSNEIVVGKMTGYGPDCKGCSGYLAYGMYVGDGTIYYNDSDYGMVRIVAGDKKYKFGTIVKINDSMLAIVLDRGGSIGIGKKFLFDLLYPSEAEASYHGVMKDVKFEILRNGF